jgi:altronate dehydratase small subunit
MQTNQAIVMKPVDNVATAVQVIEPNVAVIVDLAGEKVTIQVTEPIPFGHKFAIKDIAKGETIRKYGESIGAAIINIKTGQHVHVHNIEGCRGRGDKNV